MGTALPGYRALYPTDRERFERVEIQDGQPLPPVTLTGRDGHPRTWEAAWRERPVVFIAVSRSCPVARFRMMDLHPLRKAFGDRIGPVLVYTLDAHPDRDPSPDRADRKPWLKNRK